MPGSRGRTWRIVAVLAAGLIGGPVAAQSPSTPEPESTITPANAGPGSVAWPGRTTAPVALPPLLEAAPSAFPVAPVDVRPLPGSLVDEYEKELEARRSFRYCTWKGTTITALPNTLLWNPPFASLREPRLYLVRSQVNTADSNFAIDTSIGGVVGLFRADFAGHDVSAQFDLGAVVHTRLTPDNLIAADYRFQFPITFRWGAWHAKFAYEHTSTHIGDKFIRLNPLLPIPNSAKDEGVVGLGRYLWDDQLRLYGQVSYAFSEQLPVESKNAFRYDAGFEWVMPGPTGWSGHPFLAANVDVQGSQKFTPNVNTQAGWLWRNPYQRLANIRIFGQYYTGRSPYGQFFYNREKYYSVGITCDY